VEAAPSSHALPCAIQLFECADRTGGEIGGSWVDSLVQQKYVYVYVHIHREKPNVRLCRHTTNRALIVFGEINREAKAKVQRGLESLYHGTHV
jgi:hypothetical protein